MIIYRMYWIHVIQPQAGIAKIRFWDPITLELG